ncbi:MAG TPA: hypothetical protein VEQ59_22595 [Polyangiaceae bacterium]|nr:hypothetical protein [Polyangiaceae bacterium]
MAALGRHVRTQSIARDAVGEVSLDDVSGETRPSDVPSKSETYSRFARR